MSNKLILSLFITSMLFQFSKSVHASPVYVVSDSQLVGIQNIRMGNAFYDLEFVEGSFNSLFTGPDGIDFPYEKDDSNPAYMSHLARLIADIPAGNFDTQPDLIFGCDNPYECALMTPRRADLDNGIYWINTYLNRMNEEDDHGTGAIDYGFDEDTSLDSRSVYVDWTLVSTVPVPPAVWLFGSGMICLIGIARRKKA